MKYVKKVVVERKKVEGVVSGEIEKGFVEEYSTYSLQWREKNSGKFVVEEDWGEVEEGGRLWWSGEEDWGEVEEGGRLWWSGEEDWGEVEEGGRLWWSGEEDWGGLEGTGNVVVEWGGRLRWGGRKG